MTDADDTGRAHLPRTPSIADRYADLLATLTQRQRHSLMVRLTTGFYEGWHPSRSEIADLVAVELGLVTIEESLERLRLRNRGRRPPDYTELVLAQSRSRVDVTLRRSGDHPSLSVFESSVRPCVVENGLHFGQANF